MSHSALLAQQCRVIDLGLIDFAEAYRIQQETLRDVVISGQQTLIICEHHPVFTLGRLASESNFLYSKKTIDDRGAAIVRINRGGEVTFHGPGQLVVYPILRLENFGKDLRVYLGKLEEVAIDFLRHFDIVAGRFPGQRGVWVNERKIASIGIGVKKWVSFHGMAVNVSTDLSYFAMIKPCGLNVAMTSMSQILGRMVTVNQVKEQFVKCFRKCFNLELAVKES